MEMIHSSWLFALANILAIIFVSVIFLLVCAAGYMYVTDRLQTKHAIRRNYPVIGRFRYVLENLGEFFRQYFFSMDREEMPFNRAERSWVYRAAKNVDRTLAFGSTRDLRPSGSIYFVNCPFPTLDEDSVDTQPVVIGETCPHPYAGRSIINISGMSYGALSKPAVLALSKGAGMAGCWMNTGEGGLTEYHLSGNCDLVFQIGTGKFGVRDKDGNLDEEKLKAIAGHQQVKMFEVKLSQGAKPGKGGILPAVKVTEEIARIRTVEIGRDAISPNRHRDVADTGQLLDFIARVKSITSKPVGIKTVIGDEDWLHELFQLIRKRPLEEAPDFFTVDGAEGGSGAAPQPLLDYMGLPLRESLPMLVDLLYEYGLRRRIKVIASGKLIVPSAVAWAICVGADFITTARGFMFSIGCIQAMQCNKNTCPTGVTTHDPKLQRGLIPQDKAERVANYVKAIHYDVGVISHSCGVKEPRQLTRRHSRMVLENGRSVTLDKLYRQQPMESDSK